MSRRRPRMPAKIRAEVLACLFLMLMDRYFFDLLRWTLGRVERTARAGGAELRDSDNNTGRRLPIANCRWPIS